MKQGCGNDDEKDIKGLARPFVSLRIVLAAVLALELVSYQCIALPETPGHLIYDTVLTP